MEKCSEEKIRYLEGMSHRIREHLVEMFRSAGRGHVAGSLSVVDIMVALYFHVMRVDPQDPKWPDRDRLVLSKGHAAATLYAVLAEKGFFSKGLLTSDFIKLNGILQEHPDMLKVPGVDMSSGSLAQGLSVGLGMSFAARVVGKSYRVYVVISDAELQSGQIWEAFMACSHYGTTNVTAILDYNKLQVSGHVSDIMGVEPLRQKIEAFGWNVLEIDGNDLSQIVKALDQAADDSNTRPTMIICHTIKGKGIDFMEGVVGWHANVLSEEDYLRAKDALAMPAIQGGCPK